MGHISFLDPQAELPVDESTWVVGIFRKPYGENPEHAFIMVEGCNPGGQVYFIRYDLFLNITNPEAYRYLIKISGPNQASPADAVRVLVTDILKDEEITGQCWSILKDKAKELHNIILQEQQIPGKYNLLGKEALLPHSADASHAASPTLTNNLSAKIGDISEVVSGSSVAQVGKYALQPSGHNCFTWARNVLHLLNIPEIQQALPKRPEELAISITSRHINSQTAISGTKENCFIM